MRLAGRQRDKAVARNCFPRLLASVPRFTGELQQANMMRLKLIGSDDLGEPLTSPQALGVRVPSWSKPISTGSDLLQA